MLLRVVYPPLQGNRSFPGRKIFLVASTWTSTPRCLGCYPWLPFISFAQPLQLAWQVRQVILLWGCKIFVRRYLLKAFGRAFLTPWVPTTFLMVWVADQLISMVLPMRDLEYTICYYYNYFWNPSGVEFCTSKQRFSTAVIVTAFPFAMRLLMVNKSPFLDWSSI